jgi:hypothetical protein
MSDQVLEIQQGIWVDEQWLRDAGLVPRLQVIVRPGEIRILTAPAKAEQFTLAEKEPDQEQLPPEQIFKQKLLQVGLIQEIETPFSSLPGQDRTPVQVKGKPLSQMIIEERR